jgi:hypothetical protein
VKLVRLRRPKATCSLSYVECRPKINAAILWDASHTTERPYMGGGGQGMETENLNVVYVLSAQELVQKS